MSDLPESTSYHGFDIDLSQIPLREWLPHNFTFSELDLLAEELPKEVEGVFDIINVRLLFLVVKNNDPTEILTKLFRMLKPGGWLQWTEGDQTPEYLDFVKANPHLPGSAMVAISNKMSGQDGRFLPKWPPELPNFFQKAGFKHIQKDSRSCSDYLPWLAFFNDCITVVYQEIIERLPSGNTRRELEQLYGQDAEKAREGHRVECSLFERHRTENLDYDTIPGIKCSGRKQLASLLHYLPLLYVRGTRGDGHDSNPHVIKLRIPWPIKLKST